jgi:hypothetical protein
MPNLADMPAVQDISSLLGGIVLGLVLIDIGATGAPTVRTGSARGIAVTRNTTGTYDVTFPACSLAVILPFPVVSTTIESCQGQALSASAGTAQFTTDVAAGTAADPANGNVIGLLFIGAKSGVR